MNYEDVARHEAGHAAMATVLGLPVRRVQVDPIAAGGGGLTTVAPVYENSATGAVKAMIVALAGVIETAVTADDLPAFPLFGDGRPEERGDRRALRDIARMLRLTERDYSRIERCALEIASTPDYKGLIVAISGILDYTPVLDPELLDRVIGIGERRT